MIQNKNNRWFNKKKKLHINTDKLNTSEENINIDVTTNIDKNENKNKIEKVQTSNTKFDLINLLKYYLTINATVLHINNGKVSVIRNQQGEITKLTNQGILTDLNKDLQSILSKSDWKTFQTYYKLNININISEIGRFKLFLYYDFEGIGVVIKSIPSTVPDLMNIGLEENIIHLIDKSNGLILINGPTNSGKTTILSAMIEYINKNKTKRIAIVETPLEIIYKEQKSIINQIEIGKHYATTTEALQQIKFLDYDVVVINELVTAENITQALELANSGCLVISSLLSKDTKSSLKIIKNTQNISSSDNVFDLLSDNLIGIVCQQLLKRSDNQSLIACREIFIPTIALQNLLKKGAIDQIYSAIENSQRDGNLTFDSYLLLLVNQGFITTETAINYAHNSISLRNNLVKI